MCLSRQNDSTRRLARFCVCHVKPGKRKNTGNMIFLCVSVQCNTHLCACVVMPPAPKNTSEVERKAARGFMHTYRGMNKPGDSKHGEWLQKRGSNKGGDCEEVNVLSCMLAVHVSRWCNCREQEIAAPHTLIYL
ncbi:hypothetical protein ILYODFUR_004956 [Ilyodon furcidens]|uniref:Uncharacterized protein n=1 Tax=Ilyodon furcidens TaxID=33524 RepID=A0ABV0U3X8_9TELE